MGIVFQQQWLKAMGLLLVGLFHLLEPAVAGDIYTWTDENGTVHIDATPPADGSVVEQIIHYQNPPEGESSRVQAQPKNQSAGSKQAADLEKKLKRLKDREALIETIVEKNTEEVMAAEKDVAKYRKRSGAYARRNEKIYDRQLVVLKNNLTTYQSDLQYVKEDIAETEQSIKKLKDNVESGSKKP